MPIFLVTPIAGNAAAVGDAIKTAIPEVDSYQMPHDAGWFVSFNGTTVELSRLLQVTGQAKGEPSPVGAAVVVLINSYFGRGPTDMWEWLKTRFESQQGYSRFVP